MPADMTAVFIRNAVDAFLDEMVERFPRQGGYPAALMSDHREAVTEVVPRAIDQDNLREALRVARRRIGRRAKTLTMPSPYEVAAVVNEAVERFRTADAELKLQTLQWFADWISRRGYPPQSNAWGAPAAQQMLDLGLITEGALHQADRVVARQIQKRRAGQ